jgi:hypothetical protein
MLRFYRRRYWKIRDRCDFTQVEVTATYPEAICGKSTSGKRNAPALASTLPADLGPSARAAERRRSGACAAALAVLECRWHDNVSMRSATSGQVSYRIGVLAVSDR